MGDLPHAPHESPKALNLIYISIIMVLCLYQIPLMAVWHCLVKNVFLCVFIPYVFFHAFHDPKLINLCCCYKYFSPQKLQNSWGTQHYLSNYMGKLVSPTQAMMIQKHVLCISLLIHFLDCAWCMNIWRSARKKLTRGRKHKSKALSSRVSVYLQVSSVAKLHVVCT